MPEARVHTADLLHRVRLDRAREMLIAPDDMLTVAEEAETVGYPHPGRFAGYDAERFGELPSNTPPAAAAPRPSRLTAETNRLPATGEFE